MPATTSSSADLENDSADGLQPRECAENFFFKESGTVYVSTCVPICGEFSYFKREIRILDNVLMCVCFIASVTMIVIALTIQRKKM